MAEYPQICLVEHPARGNAALNNVVNLWILGPLAAKGTDVVTFKVMFAPEELLPEF